MVTEPDEVIIRDVLVIEHDGSRITLNSLDSKEDYPKQKLMERTVEVQIGKENRVNRSAR